ncbi:VOC family protein [Rhodoluna limnophila]|uniref:VOC family protein n=1 Tax=Rhodoluna limnophila TaxID=232537 RepID=UPI001FE6A16E|nr:VOC family protein [Rhodoluna limnophila]
MTLPANLSMGAVTLRVQNLDLMISYYRDAVGLDLISEVAGSAILGRGTTPALILEHSPALKYASENQAGLFHTAFLFDTRERLAWAVASVAAKYPGSFTGSADHLVSEAFYFDDPENNGVELYWDRARSEWSWKHGVIEMGTFGLDPNAFLAENLPKQVDETASNIGHVHLSVGSIEQAQDFYVNKLGFDVTLNYGGSALFVSAGGYHHHMAMNIWRSRGAGLRQPTLGLRDVSILLPDTDALGAVEERLKATTVQIRHDGQTIHLDDPWGNQVSLRAN